MENVESLLSRLDARAKELGISRKELGNKLGIPHNTFRGWFYRGQSRKRPSKDNLDKVRAFLDTPDGTEVSRLFEDGIRRAEKVKYLLLLLEDELQWFRDGNRYARNVFRKNLDANDIGYISSLLTMLTDEDRFNRWLALTTTEFRHFRRR
jgi:transcriptional regulator with XRE-family HTH domain